LNTISTIYFQASFSQSSSNAMMSWQYNNTELENVFYQLLKVYWPQTSVCPYISSDYLDGK
jgi:hypothetical protein